MFEPDSPLNGQRVELFKKFGTSSSVKQNKGTDVYDSKASARIQQVFT